MADYELLREELIAAIENAQPGKAVHVGVASI